MAGDGDRAGRTRSCDSGQQGEWGHPTPGPGRQAEGAGSRARASFSQYKQLSKPIPGNVGDWAYRLASATHPCATWLWGEEEAPEEVLKKQHIAKDELWGFRRARDAMERLFTVLPEVRTRAQMPGPPASETVPAATPTSCPSSGQRGAGSAAAARG